MDWAIFGACCAGAGSVGALIVGTARYWGNKIDKVKTECDAALKEQRKELEAKIEKVGDECVKREEYSAMVNTMTDTLKDLKGKVDRIFEFLIERPGK